MSFIDGFSFDFPGNACFHDHQSLLMLQTVILLQDVLMHCCYGLLCFFFKVLLLSYSSGSSVIFRNDLCILPMKLHRHVF